LVVNNFSPLIYIHMVCSDNAVTDPQNPDNDVGLACFKIKEAKKAFADAFTTLTGPKKYISESLLGKLVRVPLSLVQQRQRVKTSGSHELTDENQAEAGPDNQTDLDTEEQRLAYNYHNRYKSYTRNNDVWYNKNTPSVTRAEAGADLSTTAQRAPTNHNNTSQSQTYLPPHRRQPTRAPAPANTHSGASSTVSSASTSPTSSTLLAISVPLVVHSLSDKTAHTNTNNRAPQQRKGPQNNNTQHNSGTGPRNNSNAHHVHGHRATQNTSHSPASTSPRVTSSNNPSNTPVHNGHNNNSASGNRQNGSNQNRSGSNTNNNRTNNRNNNNNNRRTNHNNNQNNINVVAHDDEIKNDEFNFPILSKDPTIHENKTAQQKTDASNRSQHVNNNTINGNNGAGQQNSNNNSKSDKKNKRRQNTVLISA